MYLGGDLSYVNEVENGGGVFYDGDGVKDVFKLFKEHGANIVRVRLWHTPTWTAYSTFADVRQTIQRAKALDMAVLLDFHYSDTWADPAKQIIPDAWSKLTDLASLERAMYEYTLNVLLELARQNLTPEFVQVGNEINTEILMPGGYDGAAIRWERNAPLLNAGIRGVRDAGKQSSAPSRVMLHIAQPENLMPWFDAAIEAGVVDFDMIGMSYYPKWSVCSVEQAGKTIGKAGAKYQKEVMLVETAYPFTLEAGRAESHLLAEDAVVAAYPATPEGQLQFLRDLTETTRKNGGTGVIYWEPAWISTPEKPSIWENSTLFDYQNRVHKGIEFLSFA